MKNNLLIASILLCFVFILWIQQVDSGKKAAKIKKMIACRSGFKLIKIRREYKNGCLIRTVIICRKIKPTPKPEPPGDEELYPDDEEAETPESDVPSETDGEEEPSE